MPCCADQGDNSRSSLRLEFRSVADVTSMKSALRDLVADAIHVQQAGLHVKRPAPRTHRDYPEELAALMKADPAFSRRIRTLDTRSRRAARTVVCVHGSNPVMHGERFFNGPNEATCSTSTPPSNLRRAQDRIMEGIHD